MILLYYLFLFTCVISIVFLTGHLVFSLFISKNETSHSKLFYKLFIGVLSIVSFYSLTKTSGKTINIGLILIGITYVILTKQKIDLNSYKQKCKLTKNELLPLLSLFTLSLLIFIWKYYCLFNNGQDYPIVINSDSIFHSNIAVFLDKTGIESSNTNYFYPPDGTHPYHYFEGWTISLFASLFKLNHWITEELLVYPLFALITISGMWALIEKFTSLNTITKIISISIIIFSSFFFDGLSELCYFFNLKKTSYFNFTAIDEYWGLKLIVVYTFTIATFLQFIDKKNISAFLILLCIPFVTITLSPGIIGSIFTFILINKLFKTSESSTFSFYHLLLPISIFIIIILFYLTLGASVDYITIPTLKEILDEFSTIIAIKTKIVLFIYRFLQVIVLYSPAWIVFLISFYSSKNNWKEHVYKLKTPLLFTGILIVISITLQLLLDFSFGSHSYFFYVCLPFINVFFLLLIITSLRLCNSKKIKVGISLFILFFIALFSDRTYSIYSNNKETLWNKYSPEFVSKVYSCSKQLKNKIGGRFEGQDYFNYPVVIDNVDHCSPFLSGFNKTNKDPFILTSLSSIDITEKQLGNTINKNYIFTSSFYMYCTKLKERKSFDSNEKARLSFIKKYKIEYLVLNKNVTLDNLLKPMIKKQIKDPKSGITFILLDYQKIQHSK